MKRLRQWMLGAGGDALEIVIVGIYTAIPLAFVAWATRRVGWNVFPIVAVPIFCAWFVGRQTAQTKAWRDIDRRLASGESKLRDIDARRARQLAQLHRLNTIMQEPPTDDNIARLVEALRDLEADL